MSRVALWICRACYAPHSAKRSSIGELMFCRQCGRIGEVTDDVGKSELIQKSSAALAARAKRSARWKRNGS